MRESWSELRVSGHHQSSQMLASVPPLLWSGTLLLADTTHCSLSSGGGRDLIGPESSPVYNVPHPTFNSYSTKLEQTQLKIWKYGIIKYLPFQSSHLWLQPVCPALCNVSVSNVTMNNGCRLRLSETQGMTINRIINRVSPGYHYTTYGPCDACYAVTILLRCWLKIKSNIFLNSRKIKSSVLCVLKSV